MWQNLIKECVKIYVVKWQLMIGLSTSCEKIIISCKYYTLVKGWECICWIF
jgi:hypothetical protein